MYCAHRLSNRHESIHTEPQSAENPCAFAAGSLATSRLKAMDDIYRHKVLFENSSSSSDFVRRFTLQGLPATGLHHHLQSEAWTNHHPALSHDISRQCETSSGSRPQEHRSYESVKYHLFLHAQQWPWVVWKRFGGFLDVRHSGRGLEISKWIDCSNDTGH